MSAGSESNPGSDEFHHETLPSEKFFQPFFIRSFRNSPLGDSRNTCLPFCTVTFRTFSSRCRPARGRSLRCRSLCAPGNHCAPNANCVSGNHCAPGNQYRLRTVGQHGSRTGYDAGRRPHSLTVSGRAPHRFRGTSRDPNDDRGSRAVTAKFRFPNDGSSAWPSDFDRTPRLTGHLDSRSS